MKPERRELLDGETYLLDLWEPPENAGPAIGCLATTFTFDAPFFEGECVKRFLGLHTDQEEQTLGYLVEQSEKLHAAWVGAIVDHRHAAEQRTLGWDLLTVRVPGRVMHAKVSLLVWARAARIIVASANLTEPGYRTNLEVAGTLEYFPSDGDDPAVLHEVLTFLRALAERTVESRARARAVEFLIRATDHMRSWGLEPARGERPPRFLTCGLAERDAPQGSVLDQLMGDVWPTLRGVPRRAHVVSPFFDDEPAATLDALEGCLAKRGREPNETWLYVAAHKLKDGRWQVEAPERLRTEAATRELGLCAVQEAADDGLRPLHAKAIWLEGHHYATYLLGSSNFTAAGLGLLPRPNIEANLVFTLDLGDRALRKHFENAWIEREEEEIDLERALFRRMPSDEDPDAADVDVLPAGFLEAVFVASETPWRLDLYLDPARLPARWEALTLDGRSLLTDAHPSVGEGCVRVSWPGGPQPSLLEVRWRDVEDRERSARMVVNVDDRASLPPPEVLRALTLESMLAVLATNRPLYEALLRQLEREKMLAERGVTLAHLDPLRRHRSDAFLLQRTRRFTRALVRLRALLEKPVYSASEWRGRLRRPMGPRHLADAVIAEASSDGERAFLLCEILLLLRRLNVATSPGSVPGEDLQPELDLLVRELEAEMSEAANAAPPSLSAYVRRVSTEVLP